MKNIDRTADTRVKDSNEVNIIPRNRLYLIIPAILMLLSYMTLFMDVHIVAVLADEDSLFETLTAVAFILGAIVFAVMYVRSFRGGDHVSENFMKRFSYLLLAFVLLMSAGEELSWGQRFLGVETPDYIKEINVQDEINLHNLAIFQVSPERNILRLTWHSFWFMFTFGLPMISLLSSRLKRFFGRLVPLIPLGIGLLFLMNYLTWRIFYITLPTEVYLNFPEEIMESNTALLFLATALWVLKESPYRGKERSR